MDNSLLTGLSDLHLHLDGSLDVNMVKRLADIDDISLDLSDSEIKSRLSVSEGCRDLNEYLEKFDFPCSLLQTEAQISESVYMLKEQLKTSGLAYAEIRFAPQKHMDNGLSMEAVIEAAIDGNKRSSFPSKLIFCMMRGNDNHEANIQTVRLAKKYLGNDVCAIDLAGAEALFPTEDFEDYFSLARSLDVPFTIHAGEASGAFSIWKALEFGAKRIGHGVRAFEDEKLLEYLSKHRIPLELCPTSNLNTCVFDDISAYPIRTFLKYDIPVTINTDNMSVSDTDIEKEYRLLIDAFDLSNDEIETMKNNSINAAFS